MKILILGGSGMLGHKMFQNLRPRFPDTFVTLHGRLSEPRLKRIGLFQRGNIIEDFDAQNTEKLPDLLSNFRPQVIINCIGIIKQRDTANSHVPSIMINSLLPHRLAEICATWNGRVIHFSTDCVFSGRTGNYTEDSISDAGDLYGRTKYLGEVSSDNAVTLRTSMIGRELFHCTSLLEWLISQKGKSVKGFTKALYSGVTTNHLVDVVADLIENHRTLSGLYQVTGNTISKFDLLCMIRDVYKLDIEIVPNDTFHCDRSMRGDKFRVATGYVCPPWPELVKQLANDPTPYEQWRTP